MKGRKPHPTALKKLKGTLEPGRTNNHEPQPGELAPIPPRHLSKEAKVIWLETHSLLDSAEVLSNMDSDALSVFAETKARWIDAKERLRKEGLTVLTPNGFPVQSPYLQITNKCSSEMLKFLTEYGMTASSRTRVKAKEKEREDPMEELRNRNRSVNGKRKAVIEE